MGQACAQSPDRDAGLVGGIRPLHRWRGGYGVSFTTSPAYHIIAEEDDTKAAAIFEEGHYLYTELAAQLNTTDTPELAQSFMDYILSDGFQSMIATANWSYPVIIKEGFLPEGFAALPRPAKTFSYSEAEAEALRQPALDEWLAAFK